MKEFLSINKWNIFSNVMLTVFVAMVLLPLLNVIAYANDFPPFNLDFMAGWVLAMPVGYYYSKYMSFINDKKS